MSSSGKDAKYVSLVHYENLTVHVIGTFTGSRIHHKPPPLNIPS